MEADTVHSFFRIPNFRHIRRQRVHGNWLKLLCSWICDGHRINGPAIRIRAFFSDLGHSKVAWDIPTWHEPFRQNQDRRQGTPHGPSTSGNAKYSTRQSARSQQAKGRGIAGSLSRPFQL